MAERGFTVDPTDGSAAMVRKARERTGLPARQLRFDELDAESAYDAVWAHASLLHVSREGLPSILDRIPCALRPGGWHFANYKLGDGEGRDRLGRLYSFPDRAWLERTYTTAGFQLVEVHAYRGGGFDGMTRDWLALTVRTPAA